MLEGVCSIYHDSGGRRRTPHLHLHISGGDIPVITMAAWRTITAGRIAALALAAAAMVTAAAADNDEVDAERIEESDHILVLNSKNFDKATKEYQQLLVEWYSPSCGHCKALEPGK